MARDLSYLNTHARCPDCDGVAFIIGPSGGAAVNIKCAAGQCGNKFWFCPPFDPQRIENDDACYQRPAVNLWDEVYGGIDPLPDWVYQHSSPLVEVATASRAVVAAFPWHRVWAVLPWLTFIMIALAIFLLLAQQGK
jgi:hypothetical protein